MRILLDYRPALRNRTGVGEYAHQMAAALTRQKGPQDTITLFSSSWKDRLAPGTVAGAETLDRRLPVRLVNLAWHRLEWPPVERLGAKADVVWSMHPLLMPSTEAAQVVTIHDLFFWDHPESTRREVRRDYAGLAAGHVSRADGIIVVSENTRERLVKRLRVPSSKITVCRNGAPPWPRRTEPSTAGPILHVGTIEPRKNLPALIRAYMELLRQYPTAPDLVLAGHVQDAALLATERKDATDKRIRVLGYVSDQDRLRLYREASMLVMASSDEGFGLPALEAMTLGVPVVAADRGALPEVVGDAGILIDPDDAPAFASAMRRVLEDDALRRALAGQGVARSTLFDWNVSAAKAREALQAAVARRKGRG